MFGATRRCIALPKIRRAVGLLNAGGNGAPPLPALRRLPFTLPEANSAVPPVEDVPIPGGNYRAIPAFDEIT